MRSRYLGLLAIIVLVAIALTVIGRMPRRAPEPAPAAAPLVVESLSVELRDGQFLPAEASAGLGHQLALTLTNRGRASAELRLSGYEHQLAGVVVRPGETVLRTILLDLPGEDFAWLVDGRPLARLRVVGSHLVEGHR